MYEGRKIVAMIPARVDSRRIPKKNLRYLGDKLLIEHIIDTCKSAGCFGNIYINSPDDILRKIAEKNNINFFHREIWNKNRVETNDDFTHQFLSYRAIINSEPEICILANPTSPFITVDDIHGFLNFMFQGDFETVLTVKDLYVQCLHKNNPINFNPKKKMVPTQKLAPVRMLANGLMG